MSPLVPVRRVWRRQIALGADEQARLAGTDVLTEVLAGRRTTESAAGVLGVSLRQTQRLLARYQDGGGAALIHWSRGRTASNRLNDGVRDYVLELVRQNYRDFGPTLAAEVLLEPHGVDGLP